MAYISPNSQSYNFTHMFSLTDRRGPLPKKEPCPGSLLDVISKDPRFTKFKSILEKAMMTEFLNSPVANYTVFVADDTHLKYFGPFIDNMDLLTARRIVKNSIVYGRLSSEVLKDSPISYLYTSQDNSRDRLCITNMDDKTIIDGTNEVIEWDILANNGIIHVVEGLLIPYIV